MLVQNLINAGFVNIKSWESVKLFLKNAQNLNKMKNLLENKRRLCVAGFIPFLCVFSITLIQTNVVFALDGMINHTAIDWARPKQREHFHSIDHINTCIQVKM